MFLDAGNPSSIALFQGGKGTRLHSAERPWHTGRMAHPPEEVIKERLAEAANQVEVGALYAHYKHPEKLYKVVGIAIEEATDLPCVIYEWQYGGGFTFVRPLTSWLDEIEKDGVRVPRFKKV